MRWLFTGSRKTRRVKGGEVFRQQCPDCKADATFYEVEITTSAGVFFVDVVGDSERAYVCSECNETFDLKDKGAAPAAKPAAALPQPAPRDLLATLEAENDRRAALTAARDRKVDDELAELKRKLGK